MVHPVRSLDEEMLLPYFPKPTDPLDDLLLCSRKATEPITVLDVDVTSRRLFWRWALLQLRCRRDRDAETRSKA